MTFGIAWDLKYIPLTDEHNFGQFLLCLSYFEYSRYTRQTFRELLNMKINNSLKYLEN